MEIYPKDCEERKIGSRARAIFPYKLNSNYWEFHEQTGTDHGTDMIIELIEDDKFKNNKIECQIKGTTILKKYRTKKYISFPIDIKTLNYALNCKNAFMIVLVDVITEKIYYKPIQDYFIANIEYFDKLKMNKKKMSIHFDDNDELCEDNEFDLQNIAKSIYIRQSKNEILKITRI